MAAANVKFYDQSMDDECLAETAARFGFTCPKSGHECAGLLIAGRTDLKRDGQGQNGGYAMWNYDGNAAAPTFTPSIDCKRCWHGHIRNGRTIDCQGNDEPEPPTRK